jgi:cell shape-determining protein MreD
MDSAQPRRLEEYLTYELLLVLTMAALALVQVTLLPTPLGFSPALLLVLVVCRVLLAIGLPHPDKEVAVAFRWAFYGGIALDLFSASPVGSHALALLMAATIVFAIARTLRVEGPLLPLGSVLVGGVAYEIGLALLANPLMMVHHWPTYALVVMVPSVLLSLILTLPLFFALRWLAHGRRTKERDEGR